MESKERHPLDLAGMTVEQRDRWTNLNSAIWELMQLANFVEKQNTRSIKYRYFEEGKGVRNDYARSTFSDDVTPILAVIDERIIANKKELAEFMDAVRRPNGERYTSPMVKMEWQQVKED